MKIGDVVVIRDDKVASRNSWRIGRLQSFITGKDEKIRGAVLNVMSSEGKRMKISTPLQKLIPLEVSPECNSNEFSIGDYVETGNRDESVSDNSIPDDKCQSNEIENDPNSDKLSPSKNSNDRPRRTAAKTGELKRRLICNKFGD